MSKENRNELKGSLPPQDIEAEKGLLGIIIDQYRLFDDIIDIVTSSSMFYKLENQLVYEAFLKLYSEGYPVDLITINDKLKQLDYLQKVGGITYCMELIKSVTSVAPLKEYAYIIKDKYLKRELISAAYEIIKNGYDDGMDADEAIYHANESIYRLTTNDTTDDTESLKEIGKNLSKELQVIRETKEGVTGFPTGIDYIDYHTSGFQDGDLILIGARPGVGKTSLALNLAFNGLSLKDDDSKVMFFSMEMYKNRIGRRVVSFSEQFEFSKLVNPKKFHNDEFQLLQSKLGNLTDRLLINDSSGITTTQIRNKLRKAAQKNDIRAVFIDYLQLIKAEDPKLIREQQVSKISWDLKMIAKEFEVPVIALTQLNRQVENRPNNKPNKSDLRESGSLEQDANIIFFLYPPTKGEIDQDSTLEDVIYLSCEKNRDGSTFEMFLEFRKKYQLFQQHFTSTIELSRLRNIPESNNQPMTIDNPSAGINNRNKPQDFDDYLNELKNNTEPPF